MPALRRRTAEEVVWALLWAMFGGALIGGLCLTFALFPLERFLEEPWTLLSAPVLIGMVSLLVVLPCTLIFGLTSVALIHHFKLGRWSALAAAIAAALATQIASVCIFFWHDEATLGEGMWTTPFALGAAVVLWWRMTRA